MYFASIMWPESAANISANAFAVSGNLALGKLERALKVLSGRHEALRTTFLEQGGEVLQIVRDAGDGDVAQAPLIGVAEAEGKSLDERREWAEAEAKRLSGVPFDISSGPLWRTNVIRVSSSQYYLIFAFHHIITDEISAEIFADELRLAYADPRSPALTEPAAQYSEFCLAEGGGEIDPAGLAYWRGQLAGVQQMRLPEDGRGRSDAIAGSRLMLALPENVIAEFEAFCRERSVTPFTGLLAIYYILLQRWAGASDVTVGTQVFSRPESAFRTIGFFANTVVLRCQVRPALTFDQFLGRVRQTVLRALDFQDVPFEAVVDALAPDREADRNPLVQVAISYGSLDSGEIWALDGLQVTPVPEPAEVSGLQFDLTLDIQRLAGEVVLAVEYDRQRFSEAAMQQFAEAYANLLRALSRAPDAPLGSIPVLGRDALAETLVLGASGETQDGPVQGKCTSAWDLFELTAATAPERGAVSAGGERLTFAELASRAKAMAAALRARGVRAGSMVGICLPRGGDLIAAMLATWCAGGAFLLLDPGQPAARRRLLAEETGIALVVADDAFTETATVTAAALRTEPAAHGDSEPADPALFARGPASAPAYVVFTSGSTGQPKGVIVDQASLVGHAATQLAPLYGRLPSGRQVNVAGLSSVTFDVFIDQCLGMIAFGHRLLLIDEDERTDPLRILDRGSDPESAVHVLDCCSSEMEILVDAGLLALPHPPKMVLIGGESASERLWQRLHEQPGLLAFNVYGITECTIDTAIADIRDYPEQVAGCAIGTSRIYVVDEQFQLLPPLFVGEVCIGGLGVAQGYVGQPAYTSERFIADPFSAIPGQRMYRTGDKGRLRPDGQLEYWGRVDDQVKVRGQRVEPGEVEAALLGHPAVARAAVVATDAGTRVAQLVAYVVLSDEGADGPAPAGIREYLRRRLPSALLPDRVEVLDEFPITSNGKLDRNALASLRPAARRSVRSPVGSRERQLCEIVAEVVGVPQAGLDDNFFALGGNSLLAVQVTSRVRAALDCELSVRAIFEAKSIEDIATQVSAGAKPRPALRRRNA
jgi:amino acid adenylation domain-containing protein